MESWLTWGAIETSFSFLSWPFSYHPLGGLGNRLEFSSITAFRRAWRNAMTAGCWHESIWWWQILPSFAVLEAISIPVAQARRLADPPHNMCSAWTLIVASPCARATPLNRAPQYPPSSTPPWQAPSPPSHAPLGPFESRVFIENWFVRLLFQNWKSRWVLRN